MRLPIGFVYSADNNVVLDPDKRIQDTLRLLFKIFRRTGSATATVKAFRAQKLQFPRHVYRGPNKGEVIWGELVHSRALWILHHPRYAGVFCFGRTRRRKHPDGREVFARLPREEWTAYLPDAHAAYITLAEFDENDRRLRDNAHALGLDRGKGPPREGPARILALATDFPRLWNDPRTPDRERKRMARLLIEDVTLRRAKDVALQIRFKGGATRMLTLPLPKSGRPTPPDVVAAIDHLLDDHTDGEIATLLNERRMTSGAGLPFDGKVVARLRHTHGLKDRYARLRARGLLDLREIARELDIAPNTAKIWHRAGLLRAHRYNEKGECLFEPPGADAPMKYMNQRMRRGRLAAAS